MQRNEKLASVYLVPLGLHCGFFKNEAGICATSRNLNGKASKVRDMKADI